MPSAQLAYLSFDLVPAPKGAAVHIAAFVKALAAQFGAVQLVTVAPEIEVVTGELCPEVYQTAFPAVGKTLIDRVRHFRRQLQQWLQGQRFAAIHIRSIYEGFPIAQAKERYCDRLIFEVNGMPSIELKYRYPDLVDDRELLHKLTQQEQYCLDAADLILTPSQVTADYLIKRRVPATKICVIPNGVDLQTFTYAPPQLPATAPTQLLYFGTLAAWQGVDLAIRAVAIAHQSFPTHLTVLATAKPRYLQDVRSLAQKLGIGQQLTLLEPTSQAGLVEHLHRSHAVLAPLTLNDRNLVQGCCPLKVLEGMAAGTPVITSDLQVIRELGQNGQHFLAVKPNSIQAIADAIQRLHADATLGLHLSTTARRRIESHYTWQQAGEALIAAYQTLGIK